MSKISCKQNISEVGYESIRNKYDYNENNTNYKFKK